MKIEYQDAGMEARLIITSTIFERRQHTHIVDELLLKLTQLNVTDEGFWVRTTIFTGLHAYVLCAETYLKEKGFRITDSSP
ncbi:TPA_asm: hypothetical protein GBZ67_21160 [Salmonella enterica subsp. diarizonae]|nr:hypothetical protein [Salmonella enterica subsp. diarizonae]ELI2367703.1 hypothetical protein [Salmonella enterica]HAB1616839.1 hypothetical protein [Salmonella enterica subsp. diarizonae]